VVDPFKVGYECMTSSAIAGLNTDDNMAVGIRFLAEAFGFWSLPRLPTVVCNDTGNLNLGVKRPEPGGITCPEPSCDFGIFAPLCKYCRTLTPRASRPPLCSLETKSCKNVCVIDITFRLSACVHVTYFPAWIFMKLDMKWHFISRCTQGVRTLVRTTRPNLAQYLSERKCV
jgi:hypothetical protein